MFSCNFIKQPFPKESSTQTSEALEAVWSFLRAYSNNEEMF